MDLFNKLTPHTTILTPNRRLAAVISKKYALWQSANGTACWPTLDILPLYPSWLERLWLQFSTSDMTQTQLLLTHQQEQVLWEKILRAAPENENLLQITDTAKMAKSAWEILKRWQVKLDDPSMTLTEDSRAFLRWAEKYKQFARQNQWIDPNSLADFISEKISRHPHLIPKQIILIGFTDIAPQYQYLLKQCEQQGSEVNNYLMPQRNITARCIGLTDTETEIRHMALWAKSLIGKSESIGCIIPNLETIREEVIRIFSCVLKPNEFNLSAGKNLTHYPVIYDALQFLQFTYKTLTLSNLSHILRSPFIGEAERERFKRATFDNRLHHLNISNLSLQQLLDPDNRSNMLNACPALAKRFIQLISYIDSNQINKAFPVDKWVKIFNDILSILGWPGERSLNSQEYQVVNHSWLPLLTHYSTLSNIMEPIGYQEALRYLHGLANTTVFQAESPEASVQILGILEAADIPFEHAWVMGLDDTTWPARPKPNPFIPLRLQKTTNMPNASAERELRYCQTLTKQLQESSVHIIFSHSLQKDDTEVRASTLLKAFPIITKEQLALDNFITPGERIFLTKDLTSLEDEMAPAVLDADILGGVTIFKTQAECPFKAFSELRLHAKKIEEPTIGLRKLDRGNVMHKALEFLWRELHDSATLFAKTADELKYLIHNCAERALQEIVDIKASNNKRYLSLEVRRLEKLLWDWLQIEKSRPPFKVIALEQKITATIGQITANFRVDRVDEVLTETGSKKQFIIDYKTGKNIDKNGWFGNRLEEPQLPIYCLVNPNETIGIAFAKLHPSKMGMVGTSRFPLHIPNIHPLEDISQADSTSWEEQLTVWNQHIEQLAADFYQGKSSVDPKDPNINCRLCGLQSLCRIHELTFIDDDYDTSL